uniref:(northern house mosquito) hypothetical protein n=1 Tax=Culex pipiens TaxID=7175 RepID=A0A8D8AHL8_CULPI
MNFHLHCCEHWILSGKNSQHRSSRGRCCGGNALADCRTVIWALFTVVQWGPVQQGWHNTHNCYPFSLSRMIKLSNFFFAFWLTKMSLSIIFINKKRIKSKIPRIKLFIN